MVNKKDLGDKLCIIGLDLFRLGYNYGTMNTKYDFVTINFKIRQKIFNCLDSFIMTKENRLKEADFEHKLNGEFI